MQIKTHASTGVEGRVTIAKRNMIDRWNIYVADMTDDGKKSKAQCGYLGIGRFNQIWKVDVRIWVNEQGDVFNVEERDERTRGFQRCDTCEKYHENIRESKSRDERDHWRGRQRDHW